MLIDLHCKTSRSPDVTLNLNDVCLQAKDQGLDGIAFCEHLSTAYGQDAIEVGKEHDLAVFIGLEIPSDKGLLLGFLPELDTYFLEEEWRRLTDLTTPAAEAVIEAFLDRKGAVIAARPYDLDIPFNMGDRLFTFDQITAVEVFNGRVGSLQNDFALEAAIFMDVPTVGGSDPRRDIKQVGQYATLFERNPSTQAQFVDALLNSEYWAVQLGDVQRQTSTRTSDPYARKKGGSSRGSSSRGSRDRRSSSGGKGGGNRSSSRKVRGNRR